MTPIEIQKIKLAIKVLRKLGKARSKPVDVSQGICHHLQCHRLCIGNYMRLMYLPSYDRIMKAWPKYSGQYMYPVPHPTKTAVAGYLDYNLWIGKYGANRRAYARYLAREFSKLLK